MPIVAFVLVIRVAVPLRNRAPMAPSPGRTRSTDWPSDGVATVALRTSAASGGVVAVAVEVGWRTVRPVTGSLPTIVASPQAESPTSTETVPVGEPDGSVARRVVTTSPELLKTMPAPKVVVLALLRRTETTPGGEVVV